MSFLKSAGMRRRGEDPSSRGRGRGCLWLLFWVVLAVIVLGLVFGGYRKGHKVDNPGSLAAPTAPTAPTAPAAPARHQGAPPVRL